MDVARMVKRIEFNIDDQVDDVNDVIDLLNEGQNIMATEIGASFPQLVYTTVDTDLKGTFVFPEKYHHIPVLYASAMYKALDSSLREKADYMTQFREGVRLFVSTYDLPGYYRDDETSQQFVATDGQTEFVITKNGYNSTYGRLKVYINGNRTTNFSKNDSGFILKDGAALDDKVTATWELHPMYVSPPYQWWGSGD